MNFTEIMSERSQTWEGAYCMILFIASSEQANLSCGEINHNSDCLLRDIDQKG